MAGRASIVGAAATHVGKVRDHNEDAHYFDADLGLFIVCDGMGGHAAGEVASALAIRTIRQKWSSDMVQQVADNWLDQQTPEAKKQLFAVVRGGVIAAHDAILSEAARDEAKSGMGTTLVGAMIVGNDMVFAHAGDSRAYLVRDTIAVQLTEDHTLLARLLAAGIDVDVSGEGSRFRSMLTNALGIGQEVKVSTFVVPLADGDRFLLCSDGISEYIKEEEVGEVLSKQPSPARAAQKLIELALERGGGDNATAVVIRVLEAGETSVPAELRKRDERAIGSCKLWGTRTTPQQRLRALRLANAREFGPGEQLPAHAMGDRVAWIVVDGKLEQDGEEIAPGTLVYPESLVADSTAPHRDELAVTRSDVRVMCLRCDDFRELCEDDAELGECLLEGLQPLVAARRARPVKPRPETDSQIHAAARRLSEQRDAMPKQQDVASLDDMLAGPDALGQGGRPTELDQILGRTVVRGDGPVRHRSNTREPSPARIPVPTVDEDEEEDTSDRDVPPDMAVEAAAVAAVTVGEVDEEGDEVGYIVSTLPPREEQPAPPPPEPPPVVPSPRVTVRAASVPPPVPAPAPPVTPPAMPSPVEEDTRPRIQTRPPIPRTPTTPPVTRLPTNPPPIAPSGGGMPPRGSGGAVGGGPEGVQYAAPAPKPIAPPLPSLTPPMAPIPTPPGGRPRVLTPIPSVPKLPPIPPAARSATSLGTPVGIVPKPPIAPPAPVPTPPEIEAFVEIEAETPPEPDDDTAVIELPGQHAHVNETTGEISPPAPLPDDDEPHALIPDVEEDTHTQLHSHPITSEEAVVVSGTIEVPQKPKRAKRISEGWGDGED